MISASKDPIFGFGSRTRDNSSHNNRIIGYYSFMLLDLSEHADGRHAYSVNLLLVREGLTSFLGNG